MSANTSSASSSSMARPGNKQSSMTRDQASPSTSDSTSPAVQHKGDRITTKKPVSPRTAPTPSSSTQETKQEHFSTVQKGSESSSSASSASSVQPKAEQRLTGESQSPATIEAPSSVAADNTFPLRQTANTRTTSTDPNTARTTSTTKKEEYLSQLKILEEDLETPLFHLLMEERIFSHLNWAGFMGNYHTLSTITLFHREILRVDDPGLHLMWIEDPPTHFIKPLPSIFIANDGVLSNPDLRGEFKKSRGLFYSYTRLIHSELDFDIAVEKKLLPRSFTEQDKRWKDWRDLCEKFRGDDTYRKHGRSNHHRPRKSLLIWGPKINIDPKYPQMNNDKQSKTNCKTYLEALKQGNSDMVERDDEALNDCHERYRYGDLRLQRINWITFLSGYGWNFWATRSARDGIFQRHKKLITAYIVYTGLILTAMQVSLGASEKPKWASEAFRYSSYLVILVTGIQAPLIGLIFVGWFVSQLWSFRRLTNKEKTRQKDEKRPGV